MSDYDEIVDRENVLDETEEENRHAKYFSISSYGADYTVDSLVKRVSRGDFYVPTFQRAFVWNIKQASRFIESLLMGLPVPGIFVFREPESNKHLIIDGQQRLKTLQYFYKGVFAEKSAFRLYEVQSQWANLLYEELDDADRRRLDDSIVHTTIFRQDNPDDNSSVYEVFERINTGGVKLSPQEIRACVNHDNIQALLTRANADPVWRDIFGKPSARLKDQELILRFFAFKHGLKSYQRPMKGFLNRFMAEHNLIESVKSAVWNRQFCSTMKIISQTLGREAFRPERPLNAAVFDSVSVAISNLTDAGLLCAPEEIQQRYRALLNDESYSNSYKRSTADEESVKTRFKLAMEAFRI